MAYNQQYVLSGPMLNMGQAVQQQQYATMDQPAVVGTIGMYSRPR